MRKNEPQTRKDQESVQVQNATTFPFSSNKALCAACQIMPQLKNGQTTKCWLVHI